MQLMKRKIEKLIESVWIQTLTWCVAKFAIIKIWTTSNWNAISLESYDTLNFAHWLLYILWHNYNLDQDEFKAFEIIKSLKDLIL